MYFDHMIEGEIVLCAEVNLFDDNLLHATLEKEIPLLQFVLF